MIPKDIHFIFGLDHTFCNKPFSYFHYLNILSAAKCNPTYKIHVYYQYKPDSIFFDALSEFCDVKYVKPDYNVNFFYKEHIGDLLRLNLLYDIGGIYLDVDVVCIKSFDDILDNDIVMGEEKTSNNEHVGLCNATILSKQKNIFIHEWITKYYTDYNRRWNYNSVILPDKLARNHNVRVLDHTAFFKYSWDEVGSEYIFLNNSDISECYSLHLWESPNYHFLEKYDNEYIMSHNDTLSNIYKCII